MSHQICPPCREAADADVQRRASLPDWPVKHDPAICRDAAVQPHGCACQHGRNGGQRAATEGNDHG